MKHRIRIEMYNDDMSYKASREYRNIDRYAILKDGKTILCMEVINNLEIGSFREYALHIKGPYALTFEPEEDDCDETC